MIKHIDHIGVAVNSLEETIPYYRDTLGLGEPVVSEVPTQKVRVAMFDVAGVHIELLEPTSEDSAIAKAIAKNGGRGLIQHVAFCTDDVAAQLKQAADHGCALINSEPVPGANGSQVAFLHPKSTFGVLTELCSH